MTGLRNEIRKARAEVDAMPRPDRIAARTELAQKVYDPSCLKTLARVHHPAALLRFLVDPRSEAAWIEVQLDHLLAGGREVRVDDDEDAPPLLSWDDAVPVVQVVRWDFRPHVLLAGNRSSVRGSAITQFLREIKGDASGPPEFSGPILFCDAWPRSEEEGVEAARMAGDGLYVMTQMCDQAMELVRIEQGRAFARALGQEWEPFDD
jgi:hypothetical protein